MEPFDDEGGPSKPIKAWMRWVTFSVILFVMMVLQYDSWATERRLLRLPLDDVNATDWTTFEEPDAAEDAYFDDLSNYAIRKGAAGFGAGHASSVDAFLEITAVDKVLDNMVAHHQEKWMKKLNGILNRKLVKSLNRAMSDMFTVDHLELRFSDSSEQVPANLEAVAVNVTKTCETPYPAVAPSGALMLGAPVDAAETSSCVTVSVAFMYHGLIHLSATGLRHLGSGRLPILVRLLEGFMIRLGGRRRQPLPGLVPIEEPQDGDYGMSLDIGGKLSGPLVISLDIHTSEAAAWPTPRRVRVKHVAPLALQRKLLKIKDEWGVFKRLLAMMPSHLLVRRFERGLNRLLRSYFARHQGWEVAAFQATGKAEFSRARPGETADKAPFDEELLDEEYLDEDEEPFDEEPFDDEPLDGPLDEPFCEESDDLLNETLADPLKEFSGELAEGPVEEFLQEPQCGPEEEPALVSVAGSVYEPLGECVDDSVHETHAHPLDGALDDSLEGPLRVSLDLDQPRVPGIDVTGKPLEEGLREEEESRGSKEDDFEDQCPAEEADFEVEAKTERSIWWYPIEVMKGLRWPRVHRATEDRETEKLVCREEDLAAGARVR